MIVVGISVVVCVVVVHVVVVCVDKKKVDFGVDVILVGVIEIVAVDGLVLKEEVVN